VVRTAKEKYGDAFAFHRVDFPLDDECNPGGQHLLIGSRHPAACEAAAAVRLAKSYGAEQERDVVEWLWAHQQRLTGEMVFDGVNEQFGMDLRSVYTNLLPAISRDAAEGRRLGVSRTPTYFLNGRRLPLLSAATMELAISIEIGLLERRLDGGQR
jgi:hypothetical protein